MSNITVQDCVDLRKRFLAYCDTAEQHEFARLFIIHQKLDATIERLQRASKVEDQKDTRAMFRVVLKTIGQDYSAYREPDENPVVCLCWNCGKEIRKNDNQNLVNEEIWCDECANDGTND